jgi:hypothetical protein
MLSHQKVPNRLLFGFPIIPDRSPEHLRNYHIKAFSWLRRPPQSGELPMTSITKRGTVQSSVSPQPILEQDAFHRH